MAFLYCNAKQHDSMMPYYASLESLQKHAIKNNLQQKQPSIQKVRECSLLSQWIYEFDDKLLKRFDDFNYKHIVKENSPIHAAQWAFLQSYRTQTAYLVFKGTDIGNNPQDILTDLGVLPSPLYGRNGEKEISVQSVMNVIITRDYEEIKRQIHAKDDNIRNIYITGHSLGGGLAITVGIKGIIDQLFPLNATRVQIITFGAPSAVAIEKPLDELSSKSHEYLDLLSKMTHCFVNRFDIIPRLVSVVGVKWIAFVTNTTLQYLKDWKPGIAIKCLADCSTIFCGKCCMENTDVITVLNAKFSELKNDEFKYDEDGEQEGKQNNDENNLKQNGILRSLRKMVEKIQKRSKRILPFYQSFGTFYIYTSQREPCFVANNMQQINDILSYIPSRISYNIETMQMLIKSHRITQYIQLWKPQKINRNYGGNYRNNPKFYVYGYLNDIKSEILSGDSCGDGGIFWIKCHKKYTPIGKLYIERYINDASIITSIRSKAFWSRHSFIWRLVLYVYGNIDCIEIAAGNDLQQILKIFHKY